MGLSGYFDNCFDIPVNWKSTNDKILPNLILHNLPVTPEDPRAIISTLLFSSLPPTNM